jgi:hypothetical protein
MTEYEEESTGTVEKLSRPDLMAVTSKLITHLDKKSIAGRLTDSDTEKMRDSKTRLLIEAIKTHGSLLKDETLDTIEQRLAALEEKQQA